MRMRHTCQLLSYLKIHAKRINNPNNISDKASPLPLEPPPKSLMQLGHRRARIGIFVAQCGHRFMLSPCDSHYQ